MHQFAWEPTTTARFIVLLGEGTKACAAVFGFQKGSGVKQMATIETQANCVSWSPIGRYAILAQLKKYSLKLRKVVNIFWNVM